MKEYISMQSYKNKLLIITFTILHLGLTQIFAMQSSDAKNSESTSELTTKDYDTIFETIVIPTMELSIELVIIEQLKLTEPQNIQQLQHKRMTIVQKQENMLKNFQNQINGESQEISEIILKALLNLQQKQNNNFDIQDLTNQEREKRFNDLEILKREMQKKKDFLLFEQEMQKVHKEFLL